MIAGTTLPNCYRCHSQPCECKDGCTIYHGDCREILPLFAPGSFQLVLTDPPYGISYDPTIHKQYNGNASRHSAVLNDDDAIDLRWLLQMPVEMIVWGGENFPEQLPHRGRWICWHKRSANGKSNAMPSGDFELAWHNRQHGFYKFCNVVHGGAVNADSISGNNERRFHPTQKPVALMLWCLSLVPEADSIVDPFVGSGTTLLAAKQLGRKCIGIEIEEKYCAIAARRLEQNVLPFPKEAAVKETQSEMFTEEP